MYWIVEFPIWVRRELRPNGRDISYSYSTGIGGQFLSDGISSNVQNKENVRSEVSSAEERQLVLTITGSGSRWATRSARAGRSDVT